MALRAVGFVVAITIPILSMVDAAVAGPALLYEVVHGQVLYAEDADQPWFPASLTKLMTTYLVFDAWRTGKIGRDAKIRISALANSRPRMRLGLGVGKELTSEEAIHALVLLSANDIAVALAEAVAGSEEAFVVEMNATAARLGMAGTRYINANGLPGEGQFTTARDLAMLTQAIVRDFPEHMPMFSLRKARIGKRTIATHNIVLARVAGGDGMKTGFTCSAGYNIVASATREDRQLVAIVLGEPTSAKRTARVSAFLEYGFRWLAWSDLVNSTTVATHPAETFDRGLAQATNLDKRIKDCSELRSIAKTDTLPVAARTAKQPLLTGVAKEKRQVAQISKRGPKVSRVVQPAWQDVGAQFSAQSLR